MTARSGAALLLTCCAVLVTADAQQRPPAAERGVALLTVDFTAVTRDGRAVDGLTPDDVTIRLGGRRRTVRSLQRVVVNDATAQPDAPALPPPFGSNEATEAGRALALVVDTDSFRAGREAPLRESLAEIAGRLSPRDRLSLVTVPYGGVQVPFTTDHTRIRAGLARIAGRGEANETGSQLACRTGRTLEALTGYFDAQGIRDTPLTILFITGGLAAPRRDAPVTMAPGICELRKELFEEVARAAGAARAQFYIIQPGDILGAAGTVQRENIAGTGFDGSDNPIEGLEHLAGVTGGKMLALTNAAGGAMARVLDESASYYVAAIDAEASDRSGRSQELEVRVSRPNVEVRSRSQIAFARPEQVVPAPVLNPSPREMLSVTTVFRDLPLRAGGYTALDAGGQAARVVTLAEPAEAGVQLASLVAALFNRDGRSIAQWTATEAELQRSPVIGAMPAEPGAYRLRVAAIDTTGRSGTADYDLEVETVQTGPLKLSSLVLGLSRDRQFVPRLQFTSEPVAIAYLELHGAPAGTRISSALELSRTMNGDPLVAAPLTIEAAGPDRYVARGALPIGAVPAGDYVVRAMVGIEGQALTRVTRTLRKR